jgi:hypothetical protein
MPAGLYRYAALGHALHLVRASDMHRVTGYPDFVDSAPLDLIMVSDFSHMIRAWLDRDALAKTMGLGTEQQVLLSQTVGRRAPYPLLPASADK